MDDVKRITRSALNFHIYIYIYIFVCVCVCVDYIFYSVYVRIICNGITIPYYFNHNVSTAQVL